MVEIHLPLMVLTASSEEALNAVASDQWPVASGQRE
jgi:hypothetical protein